MSLLRTIYSLAKYEHFKKYCDGEELPLLTSFLTVWNSLVLSEKACNLVLAADRLIGYLLCYREEISIGQRYFQPTFYRPQKIAVYFKWDDRNRNSFCAGCQREECGRSRFSSWCPRFRLAWAIEHVTDCTNKLVSFVERGTEKCITRLKTCGWPNVINADVLNGLGCQADMTAPLHMSSHPLTSQKGGALAVLQDV